MVKAKPRTRTVIKKGVIRETPAYPSYQLKKAVGSGDETSYRIVIPDRGPILSEEYTPEKGELLREADLKYITDWSDNLRYRINTYQAASSSLDRQQLELLYCRSNILYFINVYCWTYDPRLSNPNVPFVTYEFQDDMVMWGLERIKTKSPGLVEKSRDMGATWIFSAITAWCMLFVDGFFEYVLSLTENEVDNRGVDSLLGKLRFLLSNVPEWMRGGWVEAQQGLDNKMVINIPRTSSTTRGQLTGGRAGRSGRAKVAFYDEFAFVDNSEDVTKAGASLSDCQIYLSTANGMGNAFYRMSVDPTIEKLTLHWTIHPLKNKDWEKLTRPKMSEEAWAQEHDISYAKSAKGRVFHEFEAFSSSDYDWQHAHTSSYFDYDPSYDVYLGIDFGMRDPTSLVFAQIKPTLPNFYQWGKWCLVFFEEIESPDKTVDQWAEIIKGKGYRYKEIIGDYRSGNQRDATGKTWVKYLQQHGLKVEGKYNTEEAPILEVKRLLVTPGALAVHSINCPNLVKSFQNWGYPIDKSSGLVLHNAKPNHDQFSHSMKAVCYLVDYVFSETREKAYTHDSDWDFGVLSSRRYI
jgi:hypothetical protein